MSKYQITELALKLLALGCFIYALSHAGYSLSFLFIPEAQFSSDYKVIAFFAPILGPILAGTLLFFFAEKLSKHLLGSNRSEKEVVINLDPKELHSILLSIFGFSLIVSTVIPVINFLFAYFTQGTDSKDVTRSISTNGFIFGYSLQLILGIWFAFGAKGISSVIYKLRYSAR